MWEDQEKKHLYVIWHNKKQPEQCCLATATTAAAATTTNWRVLYLVTAKATNKSIKGIIQIVERVNNNSDQSAVGGVTSVGANVYHGGGAAASRTGCGVRARIGSGVAYNVGRVDTSRCITSNIGAPIINSSRLRMSRTAQVEHVGHRIP
ncbi:unnamed protein product [Rotaria socialis]